MPLIYNSRKLRTVQDVKLMSRSTSQSNMLKFNLLTGEGQGDVEAELTDFSLSSGSSTDDIRVGRADKKRRL